MTARPDVPDTPDRTDAIARVLWSAVNDGAVALVVPARRQADALLATDDPAAVAALAATLAERHPDALLDALTNAGVLTAEHDTQQAWNRPPKYHAARLVTVWREVQQP